MDDLKSALQEMVDEDYGIWGGVNQTLRRAVVAFNDRFPELAVVIPEDAD